METFLGRYRNLIVLAAILFAQIIGLAVQVKLPTQQGQTRLIRFWAVAAITPFEKAVVHTQNWVRDTWRGYLYLHGVRRENRELRAQIERMKLDEVRLSEDARMARRVQALLAFKEQYVEDTVAAQVIGTSGSDQARVLYIDKGSREGLKPDMAVITPTGIVGKIVQVFPESSQVLPINDQLSGVGAALKDTRLQGILKGAPNGATTLQYIMADEKVEPGDDVITSGGDRIFPKGLPVGKVVSVEPGKDLFLNIRIMPAARLDRLEEVLVVTKITEKPPDTKDLGPIRAADILAERLPTYQAPQTDASGNPVAAGAPAAPVTGTASTSAGGATGTATRPSAGMASGAAGTAGVAGGTAVRPNAGLTGGAAGTAARTSGGAPGTTARTNGGATGAGAPQPAGSVGGASATPNAGTTTLTGAQPRTTMPRTSGVANSAPTTGVNPATGPAVTGAKPVNGGGSTPGAGAGSSDVIPAARRTPIQQQPVKRVIVEPDPLPVRKEGGAGTTAGSTPKPGAMAPQQASPNNNPTQSTPSDAANPPR
jgi:rod shape-determining protein MreC